MIDPPAKLPWRAALLWALLALALASLHSVVTIRQISPSSDLWDYAQQARQISRDEGFTSLYTYPTLLGAEESPPYPVRWRMPLFSWRGAMFLKSGVPLPDGYFIVSTIAQGLLVGLVFLLGAHFHSARAGAVAAAAAVACPLLLDSYNPAMSQVPAAAMGVLIWLLLLRGKGIATAVAAGVLAAATWYVRAESLLFAPLWVVAAWRGPSQGAFLGEVRKRPPASPFVRSLLFTIVLVGLCAPWPFLVRAMSGDASPIQGNPMLLYTPQYPGYASSRTYLEAMPGYAAYVTTHPGTFALRWVKDFIGYLVDFGAGLGPIAIGLAMAGLSLREPKGRYRDWKPLTLFFLAMALQIAAFAALQRSPRFLVPVVPLACVALGVAAAPALDRFCGRRMVVLLFLLLIGERAATVAFDVRSAARRYPPLPAALTSALRGRAVNWPPGQLLLTDVPDWSAWHLDRPALLLPTSRSMPAVLRDHPVGAVLLSPDARARNVADGDSVWIGIWDRFEPLAGFRGPIPLPGGARLYER